jgi:hypothetical protein
VGRGWGRIVMGRIASMINKTYSVQGTSLSAFLDLQCKREKEKER